MKRRGRKILMVILAAVFLWSLTMVLREQRTYREGDEIYALAEQLAAAPAEKPPADPPPAAESTVPAAPDASNPADAPNLPTETPSAPAENPAPTGPLADVELDSLRAVSKAVTGWIAIPDTKLSYPVVQGKDNDYYLNHAWNGRSTSVGSIFLDYRNAADLTDFHTLIYGHRMKNGSMFATLKYYADAAYRAAHPYVYIKTAEGVRQYQIFAAYEAPVRSVTYRLTFADDDQRQELIDFALTHSVIDCGITPAVTDRILTLSTCTGQGYDTRWVVQAVEVPPPQ